MLNRVTDGFTSRSGQGHLRRICRSSLPTRLWGRGGIRSGIFYPSKVGRDDGITLWGNVAGDRLQYRFMVAEGQESNAHTNPDDNPRFAGRVSYNFMEPETTWFNKGTNLGKKAVFAVGAGFDHQADLRWQAKKDDYRAYTVDIHMDLPLGGGAATADAAYIIVDNAANPVTDSDLAAGTDGDMATGQLGYLFAERVQPFGHVAAIMPDAAGAEDTMVYGLGCNYYLKGLANKLTAEWTVVDSDSNAVADKDIVTVQAAFGF